MSSPLTIISMWKGNPSKSRMEISSRLGCGKKNGKGRWIYSGLSGPKREDEIVRSGESFKWGLGPSLDPLW